MLFSQELRERRTKMRLSVRKAAKGLGISFAALSRYERGIGLMEMSAGTAKRLADFFRWNLKNMMRQMHKEAKAREASLEQQK